MVTEKFELTELQEKFAKWLFSSRHRLPDKRVYTDWHGEISASLLTKQEYLNLAGELISMLEPVELEALGDEEIIIAICGDCPFEDKFTNEECHACQRQLKGVSQATNKENQAKGQLYRVKE